MDAITETRGAEVNPILFSRFQSLQNALGFALRITFGVRDTDEQSALWAQGRVALATVNILRAKVKLAPLTAEQNVVVTEAPPYHSWHEYGMAIDVVPMDPVPDWNTNHPVWQQIVQAAAQFGLRDGVSWKDEPHLQPMELPVSPTPIYIAMLQTNKLQAIWDFANLGEYKAA